MPTFPLKRFEPKLIQVFREGYSLQRFYADLLAGLLVGIVAFPLAISFGIASGVRPEQGLYTAIIAGFFVALLGGSRVQVSGPTGAFIVVIAGIVNQHGYAGLATATFFAGVLLLLMGALGMGSLLKFVPYPLTVGFTSAIAIVIASAQVPEALGVTLPAGTADFVDRWISTVALASEANVWSVCITLLAIAIIVLWGRYIKRVPGPLVALLVCTLLVYFFDLPVATVGTRFGSIPSQLPSPALPELSLSLIRELWPAISTIALLGAIESLLSAVVADGMLGSRHRSNVELVAQGIGNMLSPIFQGIPATGAIARTATNAKSGGRTPIAAMVHALVLLLILFFLAPLTARIPLAALSGILLVVAYHMSEWRSFLANLRGPRSDALVMVVTFVLTVLVDLSVAIEVGLVLSAFLFLHKIERVSHVGNITELVARAEFDREGLHGAQSLETRVVPQGVEVFEVFGPLFFGVIERFKDTLSDVGVQPKVFVLRMRDVPTIDASGIRALHELSVRVKKIGAHLIISGLRDEPRRILRKVGFLSELGTDNFVGEIDQALARARELLSERV
jgi:SulP family sulfate permease